MTDQNKENHFLIVPFANLSEDALSGLIDDFILREGTEYGLKEFLLSEKHEQIKKQKRQIINYNHKVKCPVIQRELPGIFKRRFKLYFICKKWLYF